jgi:hypothetical protein
LWTRSAESAQKHESPRFDAVTNAQDVSLRQRLLVRLYRDSHASTAERHRLHFERAVGAKWDKTLDRDQAKRFQGIFANQNNVCLLRDTATADFLRREFGITA